MVTGRVLRRHAGGYFVYAGEFETVLQCSLRGRLKKEGTSIVTGDLVELAEVEIPEGQERGTAVISARLSRKNWITRPFIANVEQVFIVQSIHQPEWNPLLCDRYLVHLALELEGAECFVCINKCDLAEDGEEETLRNIYEPLGYKMLFVSAKSQEGIDMLSSLLEGKLSVLLGPSGVGKSSLINACVPELNLKVDVDEAVFIGRHTTTHCELYEVHGGTGMGWVTDTPGFSIGELHYPEPVDVYWQFPEILSLSQECKFSDCLHVVESGCNVVANLEKVPESRYASYLSILEDAQNAAKVQRETSQKVDAGTVKLVGGARGKVVPKLNERFRSASRRRMRQDIPTLIESDADVEE